MSLGCEFRAQGVLRRCSPASLTGFGEVGSRKDVLTTSSEACYVRFFYVKFCILLPVSSEGIHAVDHDLDLDLSCLAEKEKNKKQDEHMHFSTHYVY